MIVRDMQGNLRMSYRVRGEGVRFCSDCGRRMALGEDYTRHTVYHPISRRTAMTVRCSACLPFEIVPNDVEDRDTPVRVSTPRMQNTEGMKPVQDESWLLDRKEPQKGTGWERRTPTHIDEVKTINIASLTPAYREALKKAGVLS